MGGMGTTSEGSGEQTLQRNVKQQSLRRKFPKCKAQSSQSQGHRWPTVWSTGPHTLGWIKRDGESQSPSCPFNLLRHPNQRSQKERETGGKKRALLSSGDSLSRATHPSAGAWGGHPGSLRVNHFSHARSSAGGSKQCLGVGPLWEPLYAACTLSSQPFLHCLCAAHQAPRPSERCLHTKLDPPHTTCMLCAKFPGLLHATCVPGFWPHTWAGVGYLSRCLWLQDFDPCRLHARLLALVWGQIPEQPPAAPGLRFTLGLFWGNHSTPLVSSASSS